MSTLISRRMVCAGALLPVAALLPGCGGGGPGADAGAQALGIGDGRHFDTAAPARWADIAIRSGALAPPPGLPPYVVTRAYAMAFLAAHDALNAIRPVYATYLSPVKAPGASPDAAVAAAVHDVMAHEYPFAKDFLDTEYAAALASITGEGSTDKGIAAGKASAAAMLAARANDGFANIQGPFVEGTLPGEYRFTPPFDFADAVHLADLKPFSIPSSSAYRVEAPYDVTSAAYAADYNEVKSLGAAVGSTRTADQSELAIFWLEGTFDSWMRIAVQLAAARGMDGWALARTLALLQVGQSDCYTAGFESKYHWHCTTRYVRRFPTTRRRTPHRRAPGDPGVGVNAIQLGFTIGPSRCAHRQPLEPSVKRIALGSSLAAASLSAHAQAYADNAGKPCPRHAK